MGELSCRSLSISFSRSLFGSVSLSFFFHSFFFLRFDLHSSLPGCSLCVCALRGCGFVRECRIGSGFGSIVSLFPLGGFLFFFFFSSFFLSFFRSVWGGGAASAPRLLGALARFSATVAHSPHRAEKGPAERGTYRRMPGGKRRFRWAGRVLQLAVPARRDPVTPGFPSLLLLLRLLHPSIRVAAHHQPARTRQSVAGPNGANQVWEVRTRSSKAQEELRLQRNLPPLRRIASICPFWRHDQVRRRNGNGRFAARPSPDDAEREMCAVVQSPLRNSDSRGRSRRPRPSVQPVRAAAEVQWGSVLVSC